MALTFVNARGFVSAPMWRCPWCGAQAELGKYDTSACATLWNLSFDELHFGTIALGLA